MCCDAAVEFAPLPVVKLLAAMCNLVFDRVSFESIPHSNNADGCANPRTNSEFLLLVPGCNVQELLL